VHRAMISRATFATDDPRAFSSRGDGVFRMRINTRRMDQIPKLAGARDSSPGAPAAPHARSRRSWTPLTGGGTAGNEELTSITGTILLVLLAVIGVTIVRIGQLLWLHLFLGLLLIGPVTLKIASTGYRFARYYTRDPAYRRKGPPEIALRLTAPIIVLTTAIVFVTGVILLFVGPADRGQLVLIHKVSFIVWAVSTVLHVVVHLPHMPASLRAVRRENPRLPGVRPGSAGRWLSIIGAVVGGLVLAIVLIPDFAAWTGHTALVHHHHNH
jgi:hypothetical protein